MPQGRGGHTKVPSLVPRAVGGERAEDVPRGACGTVLGLLWVAGHQQHRVRGRRGISNGIF